MGDMFLKLVNMSITASWMVLGIVLLRLVLKKAPRWLSCLLWGAVALRLVLPFSIESVLSLIPSTETVSTSPLPGGPIKVTVGVPAIDQAVATHVIDRYQVDRMADTVWDKAETAAIVWAIGVGVMLVYSVLSYIRLHKTVAASLRERDNIFVCDAIDSPFLLGIVKPRIYLPSDLTEEQKRHVLAHEQAHLLRRDHWFKPLGFALLSVYWFNPVLWVAYILFCRDIEAACDEKVIAAMDAQAKKSYSEALVACSMHRRKIMVCPLAFGEVGVKARIRSVLHYKKPTVWILAVSLVLCTVAAICLLTDPPEDTAPVATVEDAAAYFENTLQNEAIDLVANGGVGVSVHVTVTSELMDILRFDEWGEADIDGQSEAYNEQKTFTKSIGQKDGYSLKLCIGKVYGGVEWYSEESGMLENGSLYYADVYAGGVYYTLPQTYQGDMVYDIAVLSAAQNGEEYTGERLEDDVRRIVESNTYYTILQTKATGMYYWIPAGSETEYGPYTTQPTVTEDRDFLRIETARTEWYDLKSDWYWVQDESVYIDRLYEKRGDRLLYYQAPYIVVYDLSRGEVLASVPFYDAMSAAGENAIYYAKFLNDTEIRVVYRFDDSGATRTYIFEIEDTAKRDPTVDPPKTALRLCDKVVIASSWDAQSIVTITAANEHALRVQSETEGEKVVALSEANIVRLNALYACVKDFSASAVVAIDDGIQVTVIHDGQADTFSSGAANQRELDYFVSELARLCDVV